MRAVSGNCAHQPRQNAPSLSLCRSHPEEQKTLFPFLAYINTRSQSVHC